MSRSSAPQFPTRRLLGLGFVLALTWFAWRTPAVYPVRILVTFFHEMSHGLGAVLTGGSIERITVEANGSGLCYHRGGWRIVVLPAGYIGSMVWGCLLLILACRTDWDRYLSLSIGLMLLAVTVVYVRSTFGFFAGLGLGAAMASAGWWLTRDMNDLLLMFVGAATCLHAVFDLHYLFQLGAGQNDATFFSKEILPLPPEVWAVCWGLAALACLAYSLKIALRPEPLFGRVARSSN